MVVVDSTVWIDYLNGARTPQTEWLDREIDRQRLGLLDILLHNDRDFDAFEQLLGLQVVHP